MSFFVWCEVVCLQCSHTLCGGYTLGKIDFKGMKKEAISRGWVQVGNDWICRLCKERA